MQLFKRLQEIYRSCVELWETVQNCTKTKQDKYKKTLSILKLNKSEIMFFYDHLSKTKNRHFQNKKNLK